MRDGRTAGVHDGGLDPGGAVRAVLERSVDRGELHGAVWLVERDGDVTAGALGAHGPGDERPLRRDSILRLSSVTKPVTGVLAAALVGDGDLDPAAPVDQWLPELADRQVLVDPAGPLDRTVPSPRPVTVADLLELRGGIGMDFTGPFPGPVLGALAAAGLPGGPPAPQEGPGPDAWIAAVGGVPLQHAPGTRWLYHTGLQVLGVLLERCSGTPLPELLAARLTRPLGMRDTGFQVPPEDLDRFGPQWLPGADGPVLYDPTDGQWARPPVFPDAAAGLVSTVDDLATLARAVLDGGRGPDGAVVVQPEALATAVQPRVGPLDPDGRDGWGRGLGVCLADQPDGRHAGTYGWDGGLGSSWWTDPVTRTTAILLTPDGWASPEPPPVYRAFWSAAFGGGGSDLGT
ncbi:beta-lactamase family protein [Actinotalea ferrariae]|uniref:serine hydrolase domain-containing protein n=1 Tax=Actinotalea ferrariae TaxID=1386098 RepID=UPI001C8C1176|nr:serine hydrolase domain-containing protein [Actinotalea ferrariae]MBX9246817.1 beta-lactamase family protein [Actinotalea ferrariae]